MRKSGLRSKRPQRGPAQDTRKAIAAILAHLDRHGDSLWGHEISLPPEIGGVRIVDRTNQIQEGFWHRLKHGERRRSGRKILTYDFENLPASAALACNLQHADYVEILCGGLDRLPSLFAGIDRTCPQLDAVQGPTSPLIATTSTSIDPEDLATASLPRDDRRFSRTSGLGERIRTAARSRVTRRLPRESAR